MKSIFKLSFMAFLLGMMIALVSCQEEEPLEESIDQEQTLTATGNEMELVKRVVANDGSYDNIIDHASCFDIQFPYVVVINDQEIKIEDMADLQVVEEALDLLEDLEYDMHLVFPLTLTLEDYSELTVENSNDLYELAEKCIEGGNDDDIECIDIVYPITLFTYNPNFQLTATVEVENDMQFRRFFAGLEASDLVSFDFPVAFEHQDSTIVSVNSNSELAAAIERAKEACDEDDDDDHNDDDFTENGLDSVLVNCPWKVKQITNSYVEGTTSYGYYYLTFLEDGTVEAISATGYTQEGHWSTEIVDYRVMLKVEFEMESDFEGEWYVYEIIEGHINMITANEDQKIALEKACDYKPIECSSEYIKERLSKCPYKIMNVDGTFFEELTIEFTADMNMFVRNPNNTDVDEGNWAIEGNVVLFNDLSGSLANYIGEWQVIECNEERFKLQRNNEIILLVLNCDK